MCWVITVITATTPMFGSILEPLVATSIFRLRTFKKKLSLSSSHVFPASLLRDMYAVFKIL